jgi:hypothetical protein
MRSLPCRLLPCYIAAMKCDKGAGHRIGITVTSAAANTLQLKMSFELESVNRLLGR